MTALKLYELTEERRVLDDFLLETEGEVTPEIAQLLTEIEGKIEEKAERVALYIREQEANAAVIDEEVQRLQAKAKALRRGAAGLKYYLEGQLRALGLDKVKGQLVTVALQLNPPSVVGELSQDELADLQDRLFVRYVPARFELDKRALLDVAREQGLDALPEGLAIVRTETLRIR
jgi:Siphovirus Gp157